MMACSSRPSVHAAPMLGCLQPLADPPSALLRHLAEGEGPAALLQILKEINERTCNKKCAVGSGGKSVG